MSTIKIHGNDVEVRDDSGAIRKLIESSIEENRRNGKAPLDGIELDVPRTKGDGYFRSELRFAYFGSQIFKDALQEQIRTPKVDHAQALNFFYKNCVILTDGLVSDYKSFKNGDPIQYNRAQLEEIRSVENSIYSRNSVGDSFSRRLSLEKDLSGEAWMTRAAIIGETYLRSHDFEGKTVSKEFLSDPQALTDIFSIKDYRLHQNAAYIASQSDMSRLDDKLKDKVVDYLYSIGEGLEFVNTTDVKNLSLNSFAKRKNLTIEDAEKFCGYMLYNRDRPHTDPKQASAKETYHFLKNKKIHSKLYGELAVLGVAEYKGKDIYNDYLINVSKEDLLQGYKDNPEALKKLGMSMPRFVAEAVTDDPIFANDPDVKYVIQSKVLYLSDETLTKSLEEIANKGLSAGYAAESFVVMAQRHLDFNKENIEFKRRSCQEDLERCQKVEEAQKTYNELDSFYEEYREKFHSLKSPRNKEGVKDIGFDSIMQAAMDKAHGKEVKPFSYEEDKVGFWQGLKMGKAKKESKNEDIDTKIKLCEDANKIVEEFSQRFKEPALADVNTPSELRIKIDKAYQDKNGYYPNREWIQKTIETEIEPFDKMSALCKKAGEKIGYEVSIAREAQTSSGITSIETNANVDVLAQKAQLRQNNSEMSVQDLYAKTRDIYNQEKYHETPLKEKEPKSEPVKAEPAKEAEVKAPEPEIKTPEVKTVEEKAPEVKVEQPKEEVKAPEPVKEPEAKPAVKAPEEKKVYPLPENLSSKNESVQKAIDMVKSGQYKTAEEMTADKENFGKLPKYAQQAAKMLYASAHNSTEWDTQAKKDKYAKFVVQKAEKTALDIKRGLVKTSTSIVKKTTVSKEAMMNRAAAQSR